MYSNIIYSLLLVKKQNFEFLNKIIGQWHWHRYIKPDSAIHSPQIVASNANVSLDALPINSRRCGHGMHLYLYLYLYPFRPSLVG